MCTEDQLGGVEAGFGLLSAFSSIEASSSRRDDARLDAGIMRQQARETEEIAELASENVREQGRRRVASARALLAAAGVVTDVGTAEEITVDILQKSERDALLNIAVAGSKADNLRAAASINQVRAEGAHRRSKTTGIITAGISLFSGGIF